MLIWERKERSLKMNELKIFKNPEFGQLRMIFIDGKQYFMASDVAKALGYVRPNDAVSQHCRATVKHSIPISGKEQEVNFIPEGDVYRLIIRSKLPKAEEFERWVFDEVLPTIRKQGYYTADNNKNDETKAKLLRAEAMVINAKNRAFNTIMKSIDNKQLSPIAVQVFGLKGLESVFGVDVGNLLPKTEKTYSATEVGNMLGISAVKVGRLANANGLKTAEYGVYVMDKSKYSTKEVENFRYNDKGVKALQELAW